VSREIAALAPREPIASYLLASALIMAGDKETGLPMLERLRETRGGGQRAGWRMVEAYDLLAENTGLQSALYDILADDEQNLSALVKLTLLERQGGNLESAIELAKRLKKHYPDLSVGYLIHAQLALDEGDYGLTDELLERGLELSGYSLTVARWYMALRGEAGEERISRLLRKLLAVAPDAGSGESAMASWAAPGDELARDIELYEWMVESEPDNIPIRVVLARAYRAADDWREVQVMREVVRLAPQVGSFRYELAVALSENGAPTQARRILEELLASGISFAEQAAARSLLYRLKK
jgi:tetratricopeptide (TPR) repeat protein